MTLSELDLFKERIIRQIETAPDGVDVALLQESLNKAIPDPQEQELVKIWFLLDRSGSMKHLTNDVIDGFNHFVSEQAKKGDNATMSVILFDGGDPFDVIQADTPIRNVEPLDEDSYFARGNTPLYDAIATMIKQADRRILKRKKEELPEEDQLIIIFTDGEENSSRRHHRNEVFGIVNDRIEDNWTFVFMGANQDSYAEGSRIGFRSGSIQDYDATPENVKEAFGSLSRASTEFRGKGRTQRHSSKEEFFDGLKEAEVQARRQKQRDNRGS